MRGLIPLFLEVIALAIILLVIGLVAPHVLHVAVRAIVARVVLMTMAGSSIIEVASLGFYDSSVIYNFDVDGSLIYGYVRQEAEPFSFPLAAYPWQSYQEGQPPCRLPETAQRRQSF